MLFNGKPIEDVTPVRTASQQSLYNELQTRLEVARSEIGKHRGYAAQYIELAEALEFALHAMRQAK